MRFSYLGSGKFSAVDLVFYYYLAGVFDIDKTHLELTICPRHRDMFDGTKGFSTTGKLSPTKIPSSRLTFPGSMRMSRPVAIQRLALIGYFARTMGIT